MSLLFENLAIRDLRVYASALRGEVHHFLDKNGLEIDAIIRLRNGKYGLVEIKWFSSLFRAVLFEDLDDIVQLLLLGNLQGGLAGLVFV